MIRSYKVTLSAAGGAHYMYRIDVDEEAAARARAVADARVRAAADTGELPHSFGLWSVKEMS